MPFSSDDDDDVDGVTYGGVVFGGVTIADTRRALRVLDGASTEQTTRLIHAPEPALV